MRRFPGFLSDDRGSLTMEFVLWLPLLMAWLVVSAVFHDAYRNRDLATKASYTIADLISRQTTLVDNSATSPDLADLVFLQRALLPRLGREMSLRISSIQCMRSGGCFDGGGGYTPAIGDFRVQWSVVPERDDWPADFTPPPTLKTGDAPDLESGVPIETVPPMAELDTVLLVDVTVPFIPFSSLLDLSPQTWEYRVMIRPRFVSEIGLTTDEALVYFD